jgi:predicted ATPase
MRLRTLGGLELEGSAFRRQKPLLLLAYLALEGPMSRRELADLFFVGSRDPRDGLSTALRRLAVGARGRLEIAGERVSARVPCDAVELLDARRTAAPALAISLYRGPFAQGVDVPLGLEIEEWVFMTRERLANEVRDAHLLLAEEASRLGATAKTAQHVHMALGMLEATTLDGDETRRLQEIVAASRPIVRAAPARRVHGRSRTLPLYADSFVGRERELRHLAALLTDPTCRLLTLHGPGGIGKSRLAVRVAEEALRERWFRDGAAFVELSSLSAASQVLPAIAAAVDCVLQPQREALESLTRHLADTNLLLVLDNFEHILETAPLAAGLVSSCPDLSILVTTRVPLRLKEEHVMTLEGLSLPGGDRAAPHDREADALRLFLHRTRQARLERGLAEHEIPHVRTVCEFVEGSPLGIELAAAWIRTMTIAEIAAAVTRGFDLLTSSARNAPERHQSIRAVLGHSWELLADDERAGVERLSVFRGGFGEHAAERVAGTPAPLVASLVEKSLLRIVADGRFDFHPLVRQYAWERLNADVGLAHSTRAAHARYFFEYLAALQGEWASEDRTGTIRSVEQELENVGVAWEWAVQEKWAADLRIASPLLRHVFDKRGQSDDGIRLFEQAVRVLDPRDAAHRGARGRILIDQAHFYHYVGAHAEARRRARSGLDLLEDHGAPADVRDGLNILAGASWREGDHHGAKACVERSLALSRALGDERGVANSSSYLASVELALGDLERGERRCEEALEVCRRIGHTTQTVVVLKNYGSLLRVKGELDRARPLLREALALARTSSYPRVTADIMSNLALACLEGGEIVEAHRLAEQAVEVAASSGIPAFEVSALVALGRSETALDDHEGALEHLTAALGTARSLNTSALMLTALTALGELLAKQQRLEQAREYLLYVAHQASLDAHDRRLAESTLRGLGCPLPSHDPSDTPAMPIASVIDGFLAQFTANTPDPDVPSRCE